MELREKIAIVTGAGQGIGKAIALELAKAGASLVLADIKGDTIEKVKNEIGGIGRDVLAVRMDVSKWEDAERTVKNTIERFGRVDILVNNAGISPHGPGGTRLRVSDIGDQDWDKVMDVNLKGVFNFAKAVMPFMMTQRSGKIVNIGSVAGLTGGAGGPASPPYCVSKAGVICLTKVLARELAEYNINVNTICPAWTRTEMSAETSQKILEETSRLTPLGKWGKPIDIARGVLYLVSESGDYITGHNLVIDGGRTMH